MAEFNLTSLNRQQKILAQAANVDYSMFEQATLLKTAEWVGNLNQLCRRLRSEFSGIFRE